MFAHVPTSGIWSKMVVKSEETLCDIKSLNTESGPGCSKLTTLLVNVSLNFQKLIPQICQYFLLKKCEKRLSFFQQKISVYFRVRTDLEKSLKMTLVLENSWNSKKVQFVLELSLNFEKISVIITKGP